jgi:sterol desaturase/sphingolipid hydroxylase (fatty acid hydroxylase superfamily)
MSFKKISNFLVLNLSFPFLILGFPIAAYFTSREMNVAPEIIVAISLTIGFFIIYFLECHFPYFKEWNDSHHDKKSDIFHFFSNSLILVIFQNIGLLLLTKIEFTGFVTKLSPVEFKIHWFVQFLLFYFFIELIHYATHKYSHTNKFLWRLHEIHHSAKRLHALNTFRIHFLDTIIRIAIPALLLLVLDISQTAILVYTIHSSLVGFLHHSNIKINYKGWNHIFSTADLHRFHHSRKVSISNTNYGKALIIYDLIFGTYYNSKFHDITDVGVEGTDLPDSFITHSKYPFIKNSAK